MIKIVSQKILFQNDYLKLVENNLKFEKHVKKHIDVYRKPAVSVFPITESKEIYLIKQYRYLLEKEVIEAVAGIIDNEGEVMETAKKELKEETGIVAKRLTEVRSVFGAGSFTYIKQHLILAQDLSFEDATPEEDEEISLIKMSLEEAVHKVLEGEITTASSMLGILLIDKMMKEGKI